MCVCACVCVMCMHACVCVHTCVSVTDKLCVSCSTSGTSLYQILQVQRTATQDDVKKSYRRVSHS